ncbi:hypothetical protein OG921_12625 [Aldersonia sp. NBC_00410]|uniref:hypothetical protein n=1 Tax=Aldersonia sp. NBC_00410 TaxID=2975954 RepID=UPI002256ABA5|nr:hypothetical protein [Aldersonia sp. NBC_00410]MCX5044014.1 hypothetical protein [Aldersonia sp. NBC_00410]
MPDENDERKPFRRSGRPAQPEQPASRDNETGARPSEQGRSTERPRYDDRRSGPSERGRDTERRSSEQRSSEHRSDTQRGRSSGENRGSENPWRRDDSASRRSGGSSQPGRGAGDPRQRREGDDSQRRGGPPRRRGGEGAYSRPEAQPGRGGDRRPARVEEPDLPDDIAPADLDPAVRRDLLSLDKSNAESVARHLVMAAQLVDDDPRLALAHARAARGRAGRIAVVRETAGVIAYHAGEWAEALSELRAARRMAGGPGLLAVMADCERGLGRPERAIELGRSDEARALTGDDATELRIVVAGARMDLGQFDQAVVTLQTPELDPSRTGSGAARLFYAYADALVAAGRVADGLTWFLNAAAADVEGETDAEERVAELSGDAQ